MVAIEENTFKYFLFGVVISFNQSSYSDIYVIRKEQPLMNVKDNDRVPNNTSNLSNSEPLKSIDSNEYSLRSPKIKSVNLNKFPNQFHLKNPPEYLSCYYKSSKKYGVPVDLLLAITQTESSFNTKVKGKLGYGVDHGLMQINDYWIPKIRKRFNITLAEVYEPCTNIEVASWVLAHNYLQYGNWTDATGAYNAVTKQKQVIYVKKVKRNLEKLYAGQL